MSRRLLPLPRPRTVVPSRDSRVVRPRPMQTARATAPRESRVTSRVRVERIVKLLPHRQGALGKLTPVEFEMIYAAAPAA